MKSRDRSVLVKLIFEFLEADILLPHDHKKNHNYTPNISESSQKAWKYRQPNRNPKNLNKTQNIQPEKPLVKSANLS
jgi:hypothetical protein